jgi:uncharacterized protein (TIGR02118 family)
MIKLLIFFRKPTNADVFEERFSQHVQLINAMPNVQRTVVNRALGAPRGEAAYHLIHEVFFADLPAATYALNTSEGRAAGADLMSFAREIATMMFAEVWGEENVGSVELRATSAEPELAPAAAAASAAVAELAANAAPVAEPAAQKPYTIDDIIAMNRPKVEPETVPEVAAEAVAEAAPAEPPKPSRPSLGESLES